MKFLEGYCLKLLYSEWLFIFDVKCVDWIGLCNKGFILLKYYRFYYSLLYDSKEMDNFLEFNILDELEVDD